MELELLLGVPALVRAVLDDHVLPLALPALVADRAVEGVVGEQDLQHGGAGRHCRRALGLYIHAVEHRSYAGGLELSLPLYLNEAHPARADAHKVGLIAEG